MKDIHIFETHDNGGRPFQVDIEKTEKVFTIRRLTYNWMTNNRTHTHPVVENKKYLRCFIGEDGTPDRGNSVLFQISKHTYLFVGESVYTFCPGEEIESFHSPVGNSDVPYPYAYGAKRAYCLLERVWTSRKKTKGADPYHRVYGFDLPTDKREGRVKAIKRQALSGLKVLCTRLWQ